MVEENGRKVGAALVVGAGVGGMQASLDLAESGYKVYLVEKGPSIGGVMAQLDKTFPTNDCAMCTLAPRMVDCGGHLNIEKLTYSEIESFEGTAGNFRARVRKKARFVDPELCTGCAECVQHCLTRNVVYLKPAPAPPPEIDDEQRALVDRVLERYEGGSEVLVPILQDISAEINWLPPEALVRISEVKRIPLEHILRIATFYKTFSLTPRGKHIITVCTGTACHVKGAARIVDRLVGNLGIGVGETTPDGQFSLETVRCLGCCGLSPVVTVAEDLYGNLTPAEAAGLAGKYAA
jgi:NADH:ubiquinone oxidoreductase subunit E